MGSAFARGDTMTEHIPDEHPVRETAEGLIRGAVAILSPFRRQKRTRWGATIEEATGTLPGDDLVPEPRWSATHAITINAPVATVWQWLIQLGQGRGGFYSYETLENLFGCKIDNAESIHAQWQTLKVGDVIRLHPGPKMPTLPVVSIEREKSLVLGTPVAFSPEFKCTLGVTWQFVLAPLPQDGTRLLARWRAYYDPDTLANRLSWGPIFIEPIDYVMQTKMLHGLKERAERSVRIEDETSVPAKRDLTPAAQLPLRP
jgi:hypothetical protein